MVSEAAVQLVFRESMPKNADQWPVTALLTSGVIWLLGMQLTLAIFFLLHTTFAIVLNLKT